jgi:hypothetical protein
MFSKQLRDIQRQNLTTSSSRIPSLVARLDKCTRPQTFFKRGARARIPFHTWRRQPLPSVFRSPSVAGRGNVLDLIPEIIRLSGCLLLLPAPQDVGTRYQTLIACRAHPLPPLGTHSYLFLSGPLFISSLSFRLASCRITDDVHAFLKREDTQTTGSLSRCSKLEKSQSRSYGCNLLSTSYELIT